MSETKSGQHPPHSDLAESTSHPLPPQDSTADRNMSSTPSTMPQAQHVTVETTSTTDGPDVQPSPCGTWQPSGKSEHPEGDAIRRQVEYYFSDENLPGDAHMLMKTGGAENLPVSVKHICGFSRMRKYKPYRAVVESLKKSTLLNVVDGKYLQRKEPLAITPTVTPTNEDEAKANKGKQQPTHAAQMAKDQSWMTKGMLKPTGFEEYYADPPITPAVFAAERELYDRDISFYSRIETAIFRYAGKRKMHSKTKNIFDKFMKYGGINCTQRQFTGGGLSGKELEEMDSSEILAANANHRLSEDIINDQGRWEVDFEGVAKGFLSSEKLLIYLQLASQSEITATTNILRNFYNYLLHHDVCPEYTDQINAARKVCTLADRELFGTIMVARLLPGDFNSAVSRLHKDAFAGSLSEGQDWVTADMGVSEADSRDIIMAGISAHGSEEQYEKACASSELKAVYKEEIIFSVEGVEMADAETHSLYEAVKEKKGFLKPLGKLFCRRWTYPLAREMACVEQDGGMQRPGQTFTLFFEDEILQHFFPGMKVEGQIKGLDVGILWLDMVFAVSPSFFVLLPNEFWELQKASKREDMESEDMESEDMEGEGMEIEKMEGEDMESEKRESEDMESEKMESEKMESEKMESKESGVQ